LFARGGEMEEVPRLSSSRAPRRQEECIVLTKQLQGDDGTVLVTFSHEVDGSVERVSVAGEFNDWSPDAHPMARDGSEYRCCIALAPGRAYRFRYLVDGRSWRNDWAADTYEPNAFGGDDSVVDLTDALSPDGPAQPPAADAPSPDAVTATEAASTTSTT
jgi:1,4-alpha-glucan branching enzyme